MTKGDLVTVVMTGSVFPWQHGTASFEAVYEHGPSGPGDTYRFTVHIEWPEEEHEVLINGNSQDFIGITQRVA